MTLQTWDVVFIVCWTMFLAYHFDKKLNAIIDLIASDPLRRSEFLD